MAAGFLKFDEEMEDANSPPPRRGIKRAREPFERICGITFQNSTAYFGGADDTSYYASSLTSGSGIDGFVFEEYKQADTSTMGATHLIHKALNNQGHAIFRNLGSYGSVDSIQLLRNLHQDDLPLFDQTWEGSFTKHMQGWTQYISGLDRKPLTRHIKFNYTLPATPELLRNITQVAADGSVHFLRSHQNVTVKNTPTGVVVAREKTKITMPSTKS